MQIIFHMRNVEKTIEEELDAPPAPGTYLVLGGQLWMVDSVRLDLNRSATDCFIRLVSGRVQGELEEAWALWGEPLENQNERY